MSRKKIAFVRASPKTRGFPYLPDKTPGRGRIPYYNTDQKDPAYIPFVDVCWWSDNCADAAQGLRRLGYEVCAFDFDSDRLPELPLSKHTIVKADIRTTRKALDLLGVRQPKNVDLPWSLRKYRHRKVWSSTLGDVRKEVEETKTSLFIKPLRWQKAFNGHVVYWDPNKYNPRNGTWGGLSYDHETTGFPPDFPVMVSDVVDISTSPEHRIYVVKKKILPTSLGGCRGFTQARRVAEQMVRDFKNQPISYGLDIAQIEDGPYALVEVNDGFSVGNYNLSFTRYAQVIEARWREMVSS